MRWSIEPHLDKSLMRPGGCWIEFLDSPHKSLTKNTTLIKQVISIISTIKRGTNLKRTRSNKIQAEKHNEETIKSPPTTTINLNRITMEWPKCNVVMGAFEGGTQKSF